MRISIHFACIFVITMFDNLIIILYKNILEVKNQNKDHVENTDNFCDITGCGHDVKSCHL